MFEEPPGFTDPFRYAPHPAVRMAARLVMARIDSDEVLQEAFSEGKMLGVLVCRSGTAKNDPYCYIAAFSGNAGGRSCIEGFVPPIYDLTSPDGDFRRREAEITRLNRQIADMLDSDRLLCLERELADAERGRDSELAAMKEVMTVAKARREQIRKECSDPDILNGLTRESQHEKAEFRRLKKALDGFISSVRERVEGFNKEIEILKRQRADMSEQLQDWIFRQYVVHDALGESASIADIFADQGLIPPGGTGECAAPKLLEYAYRNSLKPLAMGEFWYGKASETAVRCHGRFYPSCTSKCGPLLRYMMKGIEVAPYSSHDEAEVQPLVIFEDDEIIAVEKPSGMPSVPGLDGRISLQEWLTGPVFPLETSHALIESIHPVHRLDMDTSGVMIFAKSPEAAVNLRRQFEEHSVRKTYMARVASRSGLRSEGGLAETVLPPWPQGEGPTKWEGLFVPDRPLNEGIGKINLPLSPDYDERPRQKVDVKQGKEAYTEYEVVRKNTDGTADLILRPHTGRTHQLRVHCAHSLGLDSPILGDTLYGGYSATDRTRPIPVRLHLHALSITIRHPRTGEPLTFTSDRLRYR